MTTTIKTSYGIGVPNLLGIAFIVLKLCGKIDWSWWWVTSPFWIPFAFVLLIMITAILFGLAAALFDIKRKSTSK